MAKSSAGSSGTNKETIKREAKKNSISLGWVVLSLFIAYGFFFIEGNLSHGAPSFWVGIGTPLIIVTVIVALFLASTDKTSNIAGPIIAYSTVGAVIVIVALLIFYKVFETISLGIFLLGVVDFFVIVGLIAFWRLHAWIINKFNTSP